MIKVSIQASKFSEYISPRTGNKYKIIEVENLDNNFLMIVAMPTWEIIYIGIGFADEYKENIQVINKYEEEKFKDIIGN